MMYISSSAITHWSCSAFATVCVRRFSSNESETVYVNIQISPLQRVRCCLADIIDATFTLSRKNVSFGIDAGLHKLIGPTATQPQRCALPPIYANRYTHMRTRKRANTCTHAHAYTRAWTHGHTSHVHTYVCLHSPSHAHTCTCLYSASHASMAAPEA